MANEHSYNRGNLKGVMVHLHELWDKKKYEKIDLFVASFFSRSGELVLDCLDLVEFSKDKRKPESLGNRILYKFNEHIVSNSSLTISDEVKERVLDVASISHSNLAAKLITTFEVDKPSLQLVRHHIKSLCENKSNLNAAINLATTLNLQDEFSIYDIAVPIFLQSKFGLLEAYMQGSEKVQFEMIKLLNDWVSEEFNLVTFCSEHNIRSMRDDVLRPQFKEKMLTKWLKMYGLESQAEELCPNLCRKRTLGAAKYLLYRYYDEDSVTFENAVELIKKTVGNNKWVQCKVLDSLEHTYHDYEALHVFEKLFNMEGSQLKTTQSFEEEEDWGGTSNNWNDQSFQSSSTLHDNLRREESRKKSSKEKYHCLKLPSDCITMVCDAETFLNCVDAVLEQSDLVGIDAEWLFTRNLSEKENVALLQLATNSHIFLLDMIALSKHSSLLKSVGDFLKKLFLSKEHVKVGFGLREDLKMISSTVQGVENLSQQSARLIDLNVINKHVQRLYPQILSGQLPSTSAKQATGLSKLVLQTIGAQLDKSEQISDWERRPLRDTQIKYAALDAYCLIEIHDILTSRLKQIDAKASLETVMTHKLSTARQKRSTFSIGRGRGRGMRIKKHPAQTEEQRPVMASDFRVVCDNMLQGLGRQLRCCGIDTCILTNLDTHDKAAEIARKDKRVILTSGSPFQSLSSQVPVGFCLDLPNDLKAKEQLSVVVEHYNVKVRMCDIFSRCQLCNCGKYLLVLPSDMLKLYSIKPCVNAVAQVPWEQFRSETSNSKQNYVVVCDSDEYSDDEDLLFDSLEITSKPSIIEPKFPSSALKSSSNCSNASEQCSSNVAATTGTSQMSTVCSRYNINPDCISKTSILNIETGVIETTNPANGDKLQTPLLYKQVPKPVCSQVAEFFCCIECGKVYWAGQHFSNVVSKFGDIIAK